MGACISPLRVQETTSKTTERPAQQGWELLIIPSASFGCGIAVFRWRSWVKWPCHTTQAHGRAPASLKALSASQLS